MDAAGWPGLNEKNHIAETVVPSISCISDGYDDEVVQRIVSRVYGLSAWLEEFARRP